MDNITYTLKEFKDMLNRVEDTLARQKQEIIDKAWNYFKHDVRINYIHTFGKEPSEGVMEKYKENWIKSLED